MNAKKLSVLCATALSGVALVAAPLVALANPAPLGTVTQSKGFQPKGPALPIDVMSKDWPMRGVVTSPDGKFVAAIQGVDGKNPVLSVWSVDDLSKPPKQAGSNTMRFTTLSWLSNTRLFVSANQPVSAGANSDWYGKAAIFDVTSGRFMEVGNEDTSNTRREDRVIAYTVINRLPKEENFVLVRAQRFGGSEVSRLNIVNGRMDRVARAGDNETLGWTDSDGNIRTKTEIKTIDGDITQLTYYRDVGGDWREMTGLRVNLGKPNSTVNQRFELEPVHISKDNKTIWVLSSRDTNYVALSRYDIATNTMSEPVVQNSEFDLTSATFGSAADDEALKDDPLRTFCWGGPSTECQYNDPIDQGIYKFLTEALPGRIVTFGTRAGGEVVSVRITGPNQPDTWMIFKFSKAALANNAEMLRSRPARELRGQFTLTTLGSVLPGWDQRHLGPAQWVNYAARDGFNVPGVLYLPPGYDKARDGRLPLVVMPHGGPWSRDDMDFDISFWSQMFATRGFAVLQPQYRGSMGLGKALWKGGDRQWGARMQDDKDDGARWLVAEGIADADRMMMFGYSYGGFAAAAAAARSGGASAGLWQCAISGAPAIDVERIQNDWGENRVQRAYQGNTVAGWDPMEHLDQVKIPWLVFHGDYDRQADTIHSRTAAARMRQVNPNANFRYVEIPKMAHTLIEMTPEHRRTFLPLILHWMDTNCGNISESYSEPSLEGYVNARGNRRADR
jgi:dipeptidyl aminopeptidase/acylaminoacyl peptidase